MKKILLVFLVACVIISMGFGSNAYAAPLIIDHNTIDGFGMLSDTGIDAIQANIRWHYAHTSHGGQLTTGLQRLENADSKYSQARGSSYLPAETGALNIFDGQEGDTYISPGEYWESGAGIQKTRDVLNHNPTINVSAWSWCCQVNSYSELQIQNYLDTMADFETEFPDVTFVYMTGNAQTAGSLGYNRFQRNEQIRSWVQESENRVLFDFADLDSWWHNPDSGQWEQATYAHNSVAVPVEHSQFNGNQSGHTTYESCEQKGKAVWMMMMEGIEQSNAVPVPASLWLLGTGLIALVGIKRR